MIFFFSSRRRHTRCALVTGVQTCALPISLNNLSSSAIANASHLQGYYLHLARRLQKTIDCLLTLCLMAELNGRASRGGLLGLLIFGSGGCTSTSAGHTASLSLLLHRELTRSRQ